MGRPLRIEGENLWYHVYNRGNNKQTIFFDDSDHHMFLDHLFSFAPQYEVEIHAFCLMPNHFHLLLFTRNPNLSRFMRTFQSTFVKQYNKLHNRIGHAFQARYKSPVVDSHEYGCELTRYIHLNPVRAKVMLNKPEQDRMFLLQNYKWSSYPAYCGKKSLPWPVETDAFLSHFGTNVPEQHQAYMRFILEGLAIESDPFEKSVAGSVLGSEAFLSRIADLVISREKYDASARFARKVITACSLPDVIKAVCAEFALEPDAILCRHPIKANRTARRILLWTAALVCQSKYTLEEIGRQCGGIHSSGVIRARNSIDTDLSQNSPLKKQTQAILARLNRSDVIQANDPWMEMYHRLETYYKRYGHSNVPRKYLPDIRLGAWVARQRCVRKGTARNATQLDTQKIAMLDKLSFAWHS